MKQHNNKRKIVQSAKIILFASFLLAGCGQKSETVFEMTDSGVIQATETEETSETTEHTAEAEETAGTQEQVPEKEADVIVVQVSGAVRSPGVFETEPDSRVYQVIEMAGGFTEDAFDESINQAEVVQDGQKITVLTRKEWEESGADLQAVMSGASVPAGQQDGRVNINTADTEELCSLTGVGETRAQAIIDYREKNGSFRSVEGIMEVPGIKEGLFEKIKDSIKTE